MANSRFFLHPVISHPRSRWILTWYALIGGVFGGLIWMSFQDVSRKTGIDFNYGAPSGTAALGFLLSPYFRIGLILGAVLIGSAYAARNIVGPLRRIENWLYRWDQGEVLPPLLVRRNEKFSTLVRHLNSLYRKSMGERDK